MKVEIDEELLKDIAYATGGQYFRATDNEKLTEIYNEIDKLEKTEIEELKFTSYEERFRPLVFAAMGLLLAAWLVRVLIFKFYLAVSDFEIGEHNARFHRNLLQEKNIE